MVFNRNGHQKSDMALVLCIRNTSCNKGWLQLLMHIIFGTITVTSFVLIVFMALSSSNKPQPKQQFCVNNHCRIVCNDVPFFGEREEQLINAVSEAEAYCESIAVELNRPTFKDFTLPENWLSRMPSNVRELAIIGGNINTIAPHAFLSPFSSNLDILILEQLMLVSWHIQMLVGLSNLRKLYFKNCMIGEIKKNVLKPVDDTLKFLDIKAVNAFDPSNVTGSTNSLVLREVNFSSNHFNILGRDSFSGLQKCEVLFLNSCHITSIANGTFDNLQNIRVLYLNNNFLVTIPVGLFGAILPKRPRIALQDNSWYCDCSNVDLRTALRKGLLIIEPLCHFPDNMKGLTFSDFEGYCKSTMLERDRTSSLYNNISTPIFNNGVCKESNSSKYNLDQLKIIPPSETYRCLLNRFIDLDISHIAPEKKSLTLLSTTTEWITPVFKIEESPYTMVEIVASFKPGFGLLWYQSSCRREVYCINVVPSVFKIFNIKSGVLYTFCPFHLHNGTIHNPDCVSYDLGEFVATMSKYYNVIIITCISLACLLFGAVCVYVLILKNPSLLKANKRVIFVKHKSIEALILPPNIPLRNTQMINSDNLEERFKERENIFTLPDLGVNSNSFIRSSSTTRSIVSNDGSYISALQPTEEQLKQWRSDQIVKQYDNGYSSDFKTSSFSSFYDQECFPYYTLHTSEEVYGVPQEY